jgi:hypothetical protein
VTFVLVFIVHRIVKGRELIKTFFFSMEDLYYAWDKANHGQGGEKPEVVVSRHAAQAS